MIFQSITHLKEELGTELTGAGLVMTGGCFDIFHFGHVHLLELCAKLGDMVIVVVNTDVPVSEMKGIRRPVQPAAFRAGVVEACGYVDHVLIWSSRDVIPVLEELRPHYWVKGRRKYEDVLEAELVCAYGGDLVCYWPSIDVSTSRIIESIVEGAQLEEASTGMGAGNIVDMEE